VAHSSIQQTQKPLIAWTQSAMAFSLIASPAALLEGFGRHQSCCFISPPDIVLLTSPTQRPMREKIIGFKVGRATSRSATAGLGEYGLKDVRDIKQHFAVLNIGAYHSKDVKSYSSLLALPSSRVSLTWAQDHLFPEAEAGKRVVICMRAAAYWGLDTGRKYPGTLFAPDVNRGGFLINGPEKDAIVKAVRQHLTRFG
jgi:hypothetical protein